MSRLQKLRYRLGLLLILVSIPVFLSLFSLPFLPVETKVRILLAPVLLVTGELMFWLGIILIGKEVYVSFKAKLNRYFKNDAKPSNKSE